MCKLLELLPEFLPDTFQVARVVAPLCPARGNRLKNELHVGGLPLILEHLRVFVVLNAIADGLQPYPRGGFAGCNRTRRVKEDSIARPADAWTTSGRIQTSPTADAVAGSPTVGAIIKNPGGTLGPVQKSRLDALVDRGI